MPKQKQTPKAKEVAADDVMRESMTRPSTPAAQAKRAQGALVTASAGPAMTRHRPFV